ncbi:unnamed protein product [Staurois parvus]|uniref:Uncharacterized protein n=1 Tax=Staurois parvus TaxID=386267 RepID=A0ABN9F741_9NEOB|nr:unnamed protein product [Staurois parvus]
MAAVHDTLLTTVISVIGHCDHMVQGQSQQPCII